VPVPAGARPLPGTPGSTLNSFALALFTVTPSANHFKLSVQERLNQLSWAMGHFDTWIKAQNQATLQTDNAFVGILIAPEYYWTAPDPGGERHFLDLQAKNQIELDLKILSKAYPRILLVPGTIHYDVQMDAKAKVEAGYALLKAAKAAILREKALANPKSLLNFSASDANVLNSDIPSMNRLADNLLDKKTTPRKVHNLTYLLLDGTIWSQYDKQTDYFESKSISPDKSMFIPGTQDECPMIGDATRKFRFGVEICYDHCTGVLKRRQPANLHFHLVVSDWVVTQPAHMAMTNNGYFLHASTNYDQTVVYHKLANGQVDNETFTKNLHNVTMASGHMDFYLLQLPRA
jgi:predicted amidohydrolase